MTSDDDLLLKIDQASDLIRTYLLRPDDLAWSAAVAAWTEVTVPPVVQAAVLEQVADLYLHRGDERPALTSAMAPSALTAGAICPAAEAILRATGYRDPAMA